MGARRATARRGRRQSTQGSHHGEVSTTIGMMNQSFKIHLIQKSHLNHVKNYVNLIYLKITRIKMSVL